MQKKMQKPVNLRILRVRKLLTAKELATQSGVAESNIYAIELGKWLPSLATIKKLSIVLGKDPTEVTEFKAAIEKRAKNEKTSKKLNSTI